MSRRRLMVGKEYKYIKNVKNLNIRNGTTLAGNLFNNHGENSNYIFSVRFTVRINVDPNEECGLVQNVVNNSSRWNISRHNGYLRYEEHVYNASNGNQYDMIIDFTSLGKLENNKWYTIDLYLPGNTKKAYCKINSDNYVEFQTSVRASMLYSARREVYFGRNGADGVDLRGEITLKGFSSNGTTQNIGTWNVDNMTAGNGIDYINGSGGTPSSLRLINSDCKVHVARE